MDRYTKHRREAELKGGRERGRRKKVRRKELRRRELEKEEERGSSSIQHMTLSLNAKS